VVESARERGLNFPVKNYQTGEIMAAHTETYQDCIIVIDDQHNLSIKGKSIDLQQTGSGGWTSSYLPYSEHVDLIILARKIVDTAPGFKAGV
jgi:hypothetical protein